MTSACGCAQRPCGCCDGVEAVTPVARFNRAGLPAITYRAGTHGEFLETMKARLSAIAIDGAVPPRPLATLTARDTGDLSIALLDGWATLGDVLTFYQERIANEGYLRTATERRSVLELAGLVGYRLRPGVAASVQLAYTLDANQADPVTIPAGARSQSLPGPGEAPQGFEIGEDLTARREWNNLAPRRERPQSIDLANVMAIDRVELIGATANLKAGDRLLFAFADPRHRAALRIVARAATGAAADRTTVFLAPPPPDIAAATASLAAFVQAIGPFRGATDGQTLGAILTADTLLDVALMDQDGEPATWAKAIANSADGTVQPGARTLIETLAADVKAALAASDPPAATVDLRDIADALLVPRKPQVTTSVRLARSLAGGFREGADTAPQVLVNFAPELKDHYYTAWANARLGDATLNGVYVLRTSASPFGAGAGRRPTTNADGVFAPPANWPEWDLREDERTNAIFLDQLYSTIVAPGFAVVQRFDSGALRQIPLAVTRADATQRNAYGITAKATRLTFDADWWRLDDKGGDTMAALRSTLVLAGSEPLALAASPIDADIGGSEVELDGLYKELVSGRFVILSGERADIAGVTGVRTSELMVLAGVTHGPNAAIPGDGVHTTLHFATATAFRYRRATVSINANVARATQGETRAELLGSGDGAAALQSFALKQPPLTYTAAPTAAGAASTLKVYVDDIAWSDADSLDGLGPKDRRFVTATGDDAVTTITFGDGVQGARLPSGVQNVRAVYRSGIGAGGNVRAGQISLLQTRPLGVAAVVNPLRASGGADRETRDLARENAPLSVTTLDRLVSVRDYADFTRRFAGIAKAVATATSDGHRRIVYLTIAGVDDAPIDPTSDLWKNLGAALRDLGDPALPVVLAVRELKVLALSANIRLLPDRLWEPVVGAVRAALLDRFGFARRALGQRVRVAEVIAAIQSVPGVAYVDVDAFGAIPEKVADGAGGRQLVGQGDISDSVRAAAGIAPASRDDDDDDGASSGQFPGNVVPGRPPTITLGPADVKAWPGGLDRGGPRPAELAIFTPAVPDTLILNEVA